MDKSTLLDEIRLEVGLVSDYANSQSEFYHGIIEAFGKYIKKGYGTGMYKSCEGFFELVNSVGEKVYATREKFGTGPLSLCAIKGKITTIELESHISLYAPFYDGHHLIGVLVFNLPQIEYEITDEDLIFVHEICRHIELHQNQYSK